MIADERCQIATPAGAVWKKPVPFVVGLVEHEQAHAVGNIEDLGRVRIVAEADGIHADGLQHLQPLLDPALQRRRAERPEIVVQADTFDDNALAVQLEAHG
jgi:hypothetical protein